MKIKDLDILLSFCECSRFNCFINIKNFSKTCGLCL